ncbi:hypothetical protein BKD09_41915 [Bradyrhizobium japonicum]|uniref:Uncharacterized protein n=1 Tax=Bradyrhizobium japonicum TaxID=375 RepID=A0A1L3FNJ4_BRAJP|nr:hypothetical protein BKD09_41915 [Bradyrhizobium japonicum]
MLVMDEFCFERVGETLHWRVIITSGLAVIEAGKPTDCIILRYSAEASWADSSGRRNTVRMRTAKYRLRRSLTSLQELMRQYDITQSVTRSTKSTPS